MKLSTINKPFVKNYKTSLKNMAKQTHDEDYMYQLGNINKEESSGLSGSHSFPETISISNDKMEAVPSPLPIKIENPFIKVKGLVARYDPLSQQFIPEFLKKESVYEDSLKWLSIGIGELNLDSDSLKLLGYVEIPFGESFLTATPYSGISLGEIKQENLPLKVNPESFLTESLKQSEYEILEEDLKLGKDGLEGTLKTQAKEKDEDGLVYSVLNETKSYEKGLEKESFVNSILSFDKEIVEDKIEPTKLKSESEGLNITYINLSEGGWNLEFWGEKVGEGETTEESSIVKLEGSLYAGFSGMKGEMKDSRVKYDVKKDKIIDLSIEKFFMEGDGFEVLKSGRISSVQEGVLGNTNVTLSFPSIQEQGIVAHNVVLGKDELHFKGTFTDSIKLFAGLSLEKGSKLFVEKGKDSYNLQIKSPDSIKAFGADGYISAGMVAYNDTDGQETIAIKGLDVYTSLLRTYQNDLSFQLENGKISSGKEVDVWSNKIDVGDLKDKGLEGKGSIFWDQDKLYFNKVAFEETEVFGHLGEFEFSRVNLTEGAQWVEKRGLGFPKGIYFLNNQIEIDNVKTNIPQESSFRPELEGTFEEELGEELSISGNVSIDQNGKRTITELNFQQTGKGVVLEGNNLEDEKTHKDAPIKLSLLKASGGNVSGQDLRGVFIDKNAKLNLNNAVFSPISETLSDNSSNIKIKTGSKGGFLVIERTFEDSEDPLRSEFSLDSLESEDKGTEWILPLMKIKGLEGVVGDEENGLLFKEPEIHLEGIPSPIKPDFVRFTKDEGFHIGASEFNSSLFGEQKFVTDATDYDPSSDNFTMDFRMHSRREVSLPNSPLKARMEEGTIEENGSGDAMRMQFGGELNVESISGGEFSIFGNRSFAYNSENSKILFPAMEYTQKGPDKLDVMGRGLVYDMYKNELMGLHAYISNGNKNRYKSGVNISEKGLDLHFPKDSNLKGIEKILNEGCPKVLDMITYYRRMPVGGEESEIKTQIRTFILEIENGLEETKMHKLSGLEKWIGMQPRLAEYFANSKKQGIETSQRKELANIDILEGELVEELNKLGLIEASPSAHY